MQETHQVEFISTDFKLVIFLILRTCLPVGRDGVVEVRILITKLKVTLN